MVLPPLAVGGAWGDWFYKGLELFVIACPCALVISTPVAIVSAIGHAARNGILVKGGAFLEVAGRITAVAMDKTGTLTEGKPKVAQVIVTGDVHEDELLSIAYTLEEYSTHPIARAVADYARASGCLPYKADKFRNLVGLGVGARIEGKDYFAGNVKLFHELNAAKLNEVEPLIRTLQREGHSIVIIGTHEVILGLFAVGDTIRESAMKTIGDLRRTRVQHIVMLTGDHEGSAQKGALQAGVSRYYAGLLPEQKAEAIRRLQAEGHTVAMVGDGINDAPALASADLGIAMGGAGTDTAMETADIVLMADNLEKLPHLVLLNRKANRIIKQNIWFSLLIKAAALIFIFPDLLTLWIAVLSDTGAALLVILNSMRLLNIGNRLRSQL